MSTLWAMLINRTCKLLLQTKDGDRTLLRKIETTDVVWYNITALASRWTCILSLLLYITLNVCILQKQVKKCLLKQRKWKLSKRIQQIIPHICPLSWQIILIIVTFSPYCSCHNELRSQLLTSPASKVSFKPLQICASKSTPAGWCMSELIGANMSASLIKREQDKTENSTWLKKKIKCV